MEIPKKEGGKVFFRLISLAYTMHKPYLISPKFTSSMFPKASLASLASLEKTASFTRP
jgi:hypothetical protein